MIREASDSLQQEWRDYYAYSRERPVCTEVPVRRTPRYAIKRVALRFGDSVDEDPDFDLLIYEQRRNEKSPAIVVNPIFRGVRLARLFARYFARKGFHAVVVLHEPFRYDSRKDFSQVEHYLRKAVIRNLRTLDWLERHEKTHRDKIGTFGVSFGAMIGCAVAALDPRPKGHVIALAGGPLAEVIARTRNRMIRKLVRAEARRQDKTLREIGRDLHPHILTDPLRFAGHVRRDDVAMCISLFDRVVRPRLARQLWKAMGKPRALFVPFGHYSSILTWPYLQRLAYRFYEEKFAPSGKVA